MAEGDRFYGTTGIIQSGLVARGARDVPVDVGDAEVRRYVLAVGPLRVWRTAARWRRRTAAPGRRRTLGELTYIEDAVRAPRPRSTRCSLQAKPQASCRAAFPGRSPPADADG